MYSGHLGTSLKCPDYQGILIFQVSLGYFRTITKCPDYGGITIFKGPDNQILLQMGLSFVMATIKDNNNKYIKSLLCISFIKSS